MEVSSSPELPPVAVLVFGWEFPIGEGDSQRAPALATSPPGCLPGSPIQEADLDAAAGSVTPGPSRPPAASAHFISTRGAVLAPSNNPHLDPPDVSGRMNPFISRTASSSSYVDLRTLPRGTFTLRGELMHAFISYRVATEGMPLKDLLHCCTLVP